MFQAQRVPGMASLFSRCWTSRDTFGPDRYVTSSFPRSLLKGVLWGQFFNNLLSILLSSHLYDFVNHVNSAVVSHPSIHPFTYLLTNACTLYLPIVHWFIHLLSHSSIQSFIHSSKFLCIYPPTHLSIYLSIHASSQLCIYPSIHPSPHLPICVSNHPTSIQPFAHLFLCSLTNYSSMDFYWVLTLSLVLF